MELLEPEEKIIIESNSGLLYSKKCVITNIILCILTLALIINGIVSDSLSTYREQTTFGFGGILQAESQGHFQCGWGIYKAHFEEGGDVYSSGIQSWYYGHTECLRLGHGSHNTDYSCDWYKIPNESGVVWCMCNIGGSMPIFMILLLYIACLCNKRLNQALHSKRRIFKVTFLLCAITAMCILFSIIYWITSNEKHSGCWSEHYQFVIDTELEGSISESSVYYYQFEDKQLGISMICGIIALVMISTWAFFYLFALCECCAICGAHAKYEAKRVTASDKITVEMLEQQEADETAAHAQQKAYSELNSNEESI